MLFFVVPFAGDDPVGATYATASMVTFAVMTSNLFPYGIGVAEDRAPAVGPVPADPAGRAAARASPAGSSPAWLMMFVSLVPVVLIAALLTEATVDAGCGSLLGARRRARRRGAVHPDGPGHRLRAADRRRRSRWRRCCSSRWRSAAGCCPRPGQAPGFVETIAPYLPTRGAVELMWAAVGDFSVDRTAWSCSACWTVVLAALAVWAYRRDEGRRFR